MGGGKKTPEKPGGVAGTKTDAAPLTLITAVIQTILTWGYFYLLSAIAACYIQQKQLPEKKNGRADA
jgi:hypothetical protein